MDYTIRQVTSKQELETALTFTRRIFGDHPSLRGSDHWQPRIEREGELFLYAESGGKVIGTVFGFVEDNGNLTLDMVAVDESFRRLGIAREMMLYWRSGQKHGGFR